MNASLQKQALRRDTVGRILALDPGRRQTEEDALSALFPTLPGFDSAGCVLLYASAFPEEFATAPLLRMALERGKRLVCPRLDRAAGCLRLYRVEDPRRDFTRGTLGIPEPRKSCVPVGPDEIDWVLVPGLAFDRDCYRVGRGAGHYDRLLPTLRPEVPRWALAFDCQWVEGLPAEAHDVPMDGIASPTRTERRHSRSSVTTGGLA